VTREQLEHVVRAAAAVVRDDLVVVGSQAILGEHPDAPASLLVSQEADVFPRTNPGAAIEIDGAIGDGSRFHETYGYYAHGVGPETATLPDGWEDRLVPVRVPDLPRRETYVTAWCLESHDLIVSKCAAARDRDWEYVETALAHRLVQLDVLRTRIADLSVDRAERDRVSAMLEGIAARMEKRASRDSDAPPSGG
jgi:hypothetical protein